MIHFWIFKKKAPYAITPFLPDRHCFFHDDWRPRSSFVMRTIGSIRCDLARKRVCRVVCALVLIIHNVSGKLKITKIVSWLTALLYPFWSSSRRDMVEQWGILGQSVYTDHKHVSKQLHAVLGMLAVLTRGQHSHAVALTATTRWSWATLESRHEIIFMVTKPSRTAWRPGRNMCVLWWIKPVGYLLTKHSAASSILPNWNRCWSWNVEASACRRTSGAKACPTELEKCPKIS